MFTCLYLRGRPRGRQDDTHHDDDGDDKDDKKRKKHSKRDDKVGRCRLPPG